ncbi:hypothetical protein CH278_19655 [Rhodococcus sp. 05-2254-5]|uniref:hypothetical protein n=1 Tax=unclassified Rhodococcus (in: high G+C Gram-positive bacteria) TaxID=192944 RepID=UPI000B9ADFBD|nr:MULTISPECIES: hypothetical protein [unclassified Rhodococcus (in: high G+C Gram-positive bacteria)]OZE29083.1 hypothetical protein CH278_19655 [Rhodococcus sp. 05-2254-5]OZE53783.1 hypothetical protein CH269_21970 [Rhodococcus sp. 05-2254-1]
MSVLVLFGLGILGGLFAELALIYVHRQTPKADRPDWVTSYFYWIIGAAMIAAGGILAVIQLPAHIPDIAPLAAVQLGATAPAVIAALSRTTPKEEEGDVGSVA